MTDEQLQAQRDSESPDLREARDKQAQLRSVLAALNDLPIRSWPEQLKTAVALCDSGDIAVAKDMYLANVAKRYEDA
jgi:hypothetical protein